MNLINCHMIDFICQNYIWIDFCRGVNDKNRVNLFKFITQAALPEHFQTRNDMSEFPLLPRCCVDILVLFKNPVLLTSKVRVFLKNPKFRRRYFGVFQKPGTFVVEISGFLHVSKSWGISQEITVRIVTLYDELNIVGQAFSVDASCGCPKYAN